MDLMISSTVTDTIEDGVILEVHADDLQVQAYVLISEVDLSVVERLIPVSAFESGAQIHVAGVHASDEIAEQVLQVLENMDPEDIAVFLCENAVAYAESLATLGLTY